MEYKELSTLYHMDASSSRDAHLKAELERRIGSDSAFVIDFTIGENEDRLFFTTPRELVLLTETVLQTEREVASLADSTPDVVRTAVLRGLVLDEVVSSNEIEGVRSTKRQVKDALNAAKANSPRHSRFKGFATLYADLLAHTAKAPKSPEDIRTIYNRVMDGELPESDLPDGKLFRASSVSITDGMKSVHRGLEPEGKIIDAMTVMLDVVSSTDMPALYSAIASHFLFEYTHPFYDGNGRTGRYLLALFLARPLSIATSLSLSTAITENKNTYYKAFSSAENPLNHGELTHFIYRMLGIVGKAQEDALRRLKAAQQANRPLESAASDIAARLGLGKKEATIVLMLMQNEAFGDLGDMSWDEIAAQLGIGKQMARKYLAALEEAGVVRKAHQRKPLTFALTEEFKAARGSDDNTSGH